MTAVMVLRRMVENQRPTQKPEQNINKEKKHKNKETDDTNTKSLFVRTLGSF